MVINEYINNKTIDIQRDVLDMSGFRTKHIAFVSSILTVAFLLFFF